MASVHASSTRAAADYGAVVVRNSGIFRSPAARVVLAVSTAALIMVALLSAASYNDRASNLKELSDTVLDLTQKLQTLSKENERKEREIKTLEKEYEDKKIELSWETQHVHDELLQHKETYHSMANELVGNQETLYETSKVASQFERDNNEMKMNLETEHDENAKLKVAYAHALAELEAARSQLPPAPAAGDRGGGNKDASKGMLGGKDIDTKVQERKLRGVNHYQPGDSIEILESDKGGTMKLRPGIVNELNADGTYNVVKLEHSIVLKNMKTTQIRTYQSYPEGTQALFEDKQFVYLPITIIRFVPNSARMGFELHGKYEYTVDGDETREVKECTAIRVHRLVEAEEIVEYNAQRRE